MPSLEDFTRDAVRQMRTGELPERDEPVEPGSPNYTPAGGPI